MDRSHGRRGERVFPRSGHKKAGSPLATPDNVRRKRLSVVETL